MEVWEYRYIIKCFCINLSRSIVVGRRVGERPAKWRRSGKSSDNQDPASRVVITLLDLSFPILPSSNTHSNSPSPTSSSLSADSDLTSPCSFPCNSHELFCPSCPLALTFFSMLSHPILPTHARPASYLNCGLPLPRLAQSHESPSSDPPRPSFSSFDLLLRISKLHCLP